MPVRRPYPWMVMTMLGFALVVVGERQNRGWLLLGGAVVVAAGAIMVSVASRR
ncbi:MAG: hypothetical protein QM589_04580 [Thermomicrobiales bacterium]